MTVDERYETMKSNFKDVIERLDRVEGRLTVLEDRTQALEEKVIGIGQYLEKGNIVRFDLVSDQQEFLDHLLIHGLERKTNSLETRISSLETGLRVFKEKAP